MADAGDPDAGFVDPPDVGSPPDAGPSLPDASAPDGGVPLTVAVQGSGQVTSTPAGIQCRPHCRWVHTPGARTALSASPAQGYGFSGWSGACSGGTTCEVSMYQPQRVTAHFEEGLLLHLPFDAVAGGVTADGSGHGHHGTVASATADRGHVGGSLRFQQGSVSAASSASWLPTRYTVQLWIRRTNATQTNGVWIQKGQPSTASADNSNFSIALTPAGIVAGHECGNDLPATVTTAQTFADMRWHHLALSYDGAAVRLYLDWTAR